MAEWFMVYGSTFVPIGFIIWFFSVDKLVDWLFWAGMIIGLILMIIGVNSFQLACRLAKQEKRQNDIKFRRLIREIKGIRQSLINRSETNERDDSNNRTGDV